MSSRVQLVLPIILQVWLLMLILIGSNLVFLKQNKIEIGLKLKKYFGLACWFNESKAYIFFLPFLALGTMFALRWQG